jgi:tetratricopeptide (TPR) repeat protein
LSDEVYSAAFLSSGWWEAGLQLHRLNVIPSTFPPWVAYNIAKALHINQSPEEALKFATAQPETPLLSLLMGELLTISGDTNKGRDIFLKLSKEETAVGDQAAWMSSLIFLDQGDYDKARQVLMTHPRLISEVRGQELLAKIVLKEGHLEEAEKIYSSILDKSAEAKSYFAKKAFEEKDLNTAKSLTEELLKDYPSHPLLQENYQKLIEKERNENEQRN